MTRYQPIQKTGKRLNVRKRVKPVSAKRRAEMALVAKVFVEIEPRDGHCRLYPSTDSAYQLIGSCEGESTPAHLPTWRRGTCKLPAAERSNRKTIIRTCQRHHDAMDRHDFDLDYNPTMGADGYLVPVPHAKKGAA
jgi:hypothetical protein